MTRRSVRGAAIAVAAASLLAAAAIPAGPAAAAPGPASAPQYWFDAWHIPQLWAAGARGQGITIAEIDTGVNAALPELSGRIVPGHDFGTGGNGQVDHESNTFGHGTAMASIMVARPGILDITGTSPDAKVMPIAVPLTGTTDANGNDHLGDAIRWAADHGGKIISMSLGGARNPSTDQVPCPKEEQDAVYYALSKGAVLLSAAGNNGRTTNAVEEPGVCLGVVSVGAVDSSNRVADFSSRHPYLTMTAPGVDIASLSRVPGSAYSGDGTSQATAIASAVFALVWSKYPKLTGRQLVARVLATLDRHTTTVDPAYGHGVLNAYRAITQRVASNAPNPVYSAVAPFLARYQAFAKAKGAARPQRAPAPSKSVGTFRVGSAPRLFAPRVLQGLAVLGLGLLGIVALAITAWVGQRRRAVPAEEVAERVRPEPEPDATGLVWHSIIDAAPSGQRHEPSP